MLGRLIHERSKRRTQASDRFFCAIATAYVSGSDTLSESFTVEGI